MRLSTRLCLAVFTAALATGLPALAQKVAQSPPMGWNSWNYFFEKVSDKDIRDSADKIVATGMKDAGYIYVNIDDTWEGKRDGSGAARQEENTHHQGEKRRSPHCVVTRLRPCPAPPPAGG